MEEIKCLLIGQEPFKNDNYENMKYENIDENICFNDIAFIPVPKKGNTDKNYYTKIKTYKRMLGVINKIKINDNNLANHHLSVINKINSLAKDGVYLVNFEELENINFFESPHFNDKIILICFGNIAINGVNNLNLSNETLEFPHPSGQNNDPLWYEFYGKPREYNGAIEITNAF
ncbi:hypothetical protein QI065_07835 [Staphylococcus saprophyticus]|nr:hypothetical protein [Staphylococcus saprophyticus]